MRHMRWSYPDLMACPQAYLKVIEEEAEREADAARARAAARRAG